MLGSAMGGSDMPRGVDAGISEGPEVEGSTVGVVSCTSCLTSLLTSGFFPGFLVVVVVVVVVVVTTVTSSPVSRSVTSPVVGFTARFLSLSMFPISLFFSAGIISGVVVSLGTSALGVSLLA